MERHSQYDVINRSGVRVHRFGWLKFMKFFNKQFFFYCVYIYRPTHSLLLRIGYRVRGSDPSGDERVSRLHARLDRP